MAKKLSTGLRNALLGKMAPITGTTFSCAVTTNILADSANGLGDLQTGFKLQLAGFNEANNLGLKTVTSVVTSGASVVLTENLATEAVGDAVTITVLNGTDIETLLDYCILEIYSGSQPADADAAETGTKLVRVTTASGAVTPGISTNGLRWGDPTAGVLAKTGTWSGVILTTGVAGWFRIYTNNYITGASSTARRIDGSVSTTGAQLNLSSLSLVSGATLTIDTFTITMLE